MNLDQCFRRKCLLKVLLSGALAAICEILLKGIMRNNSVKLFGLWVNGSRGDVI